MLGSLNEKKSLIYFASGIQRNGLDNQAQLRSTVNAAIRANVSFIPSTRAAWLRSSAWRRPKGSPGGQGMYSGRSARAQTSNFQNQQETLYTLAADTGGKALLDNNDLSAGIVQAQKDIVKLLHHRLLHRQHRARRQIPPHQNLRKQYALAKTISKIDYRQGYYGGKTFNKFNESDKEHQLAEALMLGDPITDMDIAMELDYFRLGRDPLFCSAGSENARVPKSS